MITLLATALIAFDTGYQYDRIDAMVEQVDTALIAGYGSDLYQYTFSSYQIGARGHFYTPSNLVIKLAASYGFVGRGRYSDDDGGITGKLFGNTISGMGGIGLSFPIENCFSLVPLIGYSYDAQNLQVRDSKSFDPSSKVNNAEGATWESLWYGPWIGFDIDFQRSKQNFEVGYEFHFGSAQNDWAPMENPAIQSYPYDVLLKNIFGHLFHFTGRTPIRECWFLGARLFYSIWSNTSPVKANIPPSFRTGLTPTQIVQTRLLSWRSFEASVLIGRDF